MFVRLDFMFGYWDFIYWVLGFMVEIIDFMKGKLIFINDMKILCLEF